MFLVQHRICFAMWLQPNDSAGVLSCMRPARLLFVLPVKAPVPEDVKRMLEDILPCHGLSCHSARERPSKSMHSLSRCHCSHTGPKVMQDHEDRMIRLRGMMIAVAVVPQCIIFLKRRTMDLVEVLCKIEIPPDNMTTLGHLLEPRFCFVRESLVP